VLLPVASKTDAGVSARALAALDHGDVTVVHVVGGDDAVAEELFDVARSVLGDVETAALHGEDVVEAIFAAAEARDSSAIVVTPRAGSRLVKLLGGDVANRLVTETERPVVVLPEATAPDEATGDDGER